MHPGNQAVRFAAEDIIAVIGKVDKIDYFEQDIRP